MSSDDAFVNEVSWNSLQSFRNCGKDTWKVNRQMDGRTFPYHTTSR